MTRARIDTPWKPIRNLYYHRLVSPRARCRPPGGKYSPMLPVYRTVMLQSCETGLVLPSW